MPHYGPWTQPADISATGNPTVMVANSNLQSDDTLPNTQANEDAWEQATYSGTGGSGGLSGINRNVSVFDQRHTLPNFQITGGGIITFLIEYLIIGVDPTRLSYANPTVGLPPGVTGIQWEAPHGELVSDLTLTASTSTITRAGDETVPVTSFRPGSATAQIRKVPSSDFDVAGIWTPRYQTPAEVSAYPVADSGVTFGPDAAGDSGAMTDVISQTVHDDVATDYGGTIWATYLLTFDVLANGALLNIADATPAGHPESLNFWNFTGSQILGITTEVAYTISYTYRPARYRFIYPSALPLRSTRRSDGAAGGTPRATRGRSALGTTRARRASYL